MFAFASRGSEKKAPMKGSRDPKNRSGFISFDGDFEARMSRSVEMGVRGGNGQFLAIRSTYIGSERPGPFREESGKETVPHSYCFSVF